MIARPQAFGEVMIVAGGESDGGSFEFEIIPAFPRGRKSLDSCLAEECRPVQEAGFPPPSFRLVADALEEHEGGFDHGVGEFDRGREGSPALISAGRPDRVEAATQTV